MRKIIKLVNKYKVYFICLTIVVLSIISIIIQNIDRQSMLKVNNETIEKRADKIAVYITGEIKNPGVYYINSNSRLENIIDIAGGITDNADLDKLNLSKKLIDSDKIVVPTKQEKITIENDEAISASTVDKNTDNKVNINIATETELMTLKGIGPATAKKIIEYRKTSPFNEIEDIMNVTGIGQSKYNTIKDNICVN